MIPSYIDPEVLAAFLESRKAHKAPFTPRAEKLLITKLMRHHEEGWDVNEALEAATISGWKSIYPRVMLGAKKPAEIALQAAKDRELYATKPPPEIMARIKEWTGR